MAVSGSPRTSTSRSAPRLTTSRDKRASGRPQDLADAELLEALGDEEG
jgi:hypothetical protein